MFLFTQQMKHEIPSPIAYSEQVYKYLLGVETPLGKFEKLNPDHLLQTLWVDDDSI